MLKHKKNPRNDWALKECFNWNKPAFKHALLPGFTRKVFVTPETCPTRSMSVWICSVDWRKMKLLEGTFDVHDGLEEAYYGIEGRMKMITPNESCTLRPGGFVWIPAGMPHSARPIDDRTVFMAIYAPARRGREENRRVTTAQAKKIARTIGVDSNVTFLPTRRSNGDGRQSRLSSNQDDRHIKMKS